MADEENVEQKQQDAPKKTDAKDKKAGDSSDKKSLMAKILSMLIILIVAAIGAAGGFTTARVVAGKLNHQDPNKPKQAHTNESTTADDENGVWYYQHEPVVSCLDEPDVKRYIRATLTFAISSSLSQEKGKALFKEKAPLLTNYLTIYLASLNLDSVRGGNSLRKIKSQICDDFNEKLFPDQKPLIKEILFKEWAIQ